MFSLGRARHTLERWLLGGEGGVPAKTGGEPLKEEPSPKREGSPDQRIFDFMEELKASSQEWLGRVRMINFDSIRERMGPTWAKLQDRVEILAEKIIQEEMAGRDRYLNAGNAEFLVFFADATPEESRIRCLAIVEAIHERLFGSEERDRKVAECHVIHRDDLALEWEAENSAKRARHRDQSSAEVVRRSFRQDAEILEADDVAASAQIVLDAIITRGTESHDLGELAPLLLRLKYLSRSLKTLEPALMAVKRREAAQRRQNDQSIGGAEAEQVDGKNAAADIDVAPLGTAWRDIAELSSILNVGSEFSHADLLAALGKLRRARLERAARALSSDDVGATRINTAKIDSRQFEYVPVYRSVSRGERIHRGIFRISRVPEKAGVMPGGDTTVDHRLQAATSELLTLEHAIQYLLDRKTATQSMLMVSVDVETLRGPNSQRRHSMVLRAAQLRAKRRLLIEVVGYADADDTIGVRRALEELRLHSHAVFLTLSPKSLGNLEKIAADCKKLGIHALGMDLSQLNGKNTDTIGALTRVSSVGKQYSVPVFVDGIRSVPVLAEAISRGVSYVCAPALHPPLQTPNEAECATLDDLYAAA